MELTEEEEAAQIDAVSSLKTRLLDDPSRTILSTNQSPDVGFDVSVNPYRGCEHSCVYCYARPTHEYLGFFGGARLRDAHPGEARRPPALLRKALSTRSWKPQAIAFSGCIPTRTSQRNGSCASLATASKCWQSFGTPVANHHEEPARHARRRPPGRAGAPTHAAAVDVSITPRWTRSCSDAWSRAPPLRTCASRPSSAWQRRASPVGVMAAPVIPGLNDHEIPAIPARRGRCGRRLGGSHRACACRTA